MTVQQQKQIPNALQDVLKAFMPLHILNEFLRKLDKPTANSWDKIFAKNTSEANLFSDLLTQVLCFGNKTIFAYNIPKVEEKSFNLSELDVKHKDINIIEALNFDKDHHVLFKKMSDGRFEAYTFICKKRAIETYVLTQSDLTNEARTKYWEPSSEIKVKTSKLVTAFDSVIHDHSNNIVFFIIDNLNYSYEKNAYDLHAEFKSFLQSYCPQLSKLELLDFFSCIDSIYQKKSEGIVHRLGFECNTGAIRDEKLKQGQLDLRNEKYHTSGKAAIGGTINPYKLGVTWHPSKYNELNTEIDFEIHGTRRSLQEQGGVYNSQLNSKITFNELTFALHRIILYVDFG
jgi:hypothetical protein